MSDNISEILKRKQDAYFRAESLLNKAADENRSLTKSETEDYNKLISDLRAADATLTAARQLAELSISERVGRLESVQGIANQDPELWTDSRGRKVEVFTRDSHISPAPGGLTLGKYLRAYMTGAQTDSERRALSEGTDSAGGYTVPDYLFKNIVDKLRTKTRCIQAGAKVIKLESDVNKIAKILTDPTVYWFNTENSEVTATDGTFGAVTFEPFTVAALVKASRELLQDSVNLEQALEISLTNAIAEAIDSKALTGAGTTEPKGIAHYSGLATTYSMGTNGAPFESFVNGWQPIISVINSLLTANAKFPTAAIMHPRSLTELMALTATDLQPLQKPPYLNDLMLLDSTAIAITDTKGTASNASKLYLGDFSEMLIGFRSDIRITPLPERYAEFLQVGFMVHARVDIQPLHEASFAVINGIIPGTYF